MASPEMNKFRSDVINEWKYLGVEIYGGRYPENIFLRLWRSWDLLTFIRKTHRKSTPLRSSP